MRLRQVIFVINLCFILPLHLYAQHNPSAYSLYQKGKQYDEKGQPKKASHYYKEAYDIYLELDSTSMWLKTGKKYASSLVYQSEPDKAMDLYTQLLQVEHPANDAYNRGDLYNSMGWASQSAGHSKQSLRYYQKALPFAEESADNELIGVVYSNLSSAYNKKAQYQKALEYNHKALLYFNRLGNKKRVAITLGNAGKIYQTLGLFDKSLSYLKSCKVLLEETGNIYLLYAIYNGLASIQSDMGNYDQALIAHQKSLEYANKTGLNSRIANSYNNIGLLYKQLGRYEKAKEYYKLSLEKRKISGSSQTIGTTIRNLGHLLWIQGKKEEASSYFRETFELRKEHASPLQLSYSLKDMIKVALEKHNIEMAQHYIRQLTTIGDTTGNYSILFDAAHFTGHKYETLNKPNKALLKYKDAYNYSQHLANSKQIDALKHLSRQFYTTNQPDSAIYYGYSAINLIEKSRLNAGAISKLKSGYFKQHFEFYIQLADWVIEENQDVSRAFKLVEQAKERVFIEELALASNNIYQQFPDKVRLQRAQKQHLVDSLYTALEHTDDLSEESSLSAESRIAELNLASFENKLRERFPRLKKAMKPSEVISLKETQKELNDQTVIIEYALSRNKLISFLISNQDVSVHSVLSSGESSIKEELTDQIKTFRNAILSHAPLNKIQESSDILYQKLIQPYEQSLKKYRNVIIIPDGALAYLPFAALRHNNQYLIEQHALKYAPSLTSLNMLEAPDHSTKKNLLAVAASDFSINTERPLSDKQLAALPSTIVEIDSISSQFKSATLLKDNNATEDSLKKLLQHNKYRYIHLATHGFIDERQSARNGLILSSSDSLTATSKEDGILRSNEIYGLDINADLVVLSACNTGMGEIVGGEGILGLQRSLFYAGTSTVVVSLWNVYDRSTATFMNRFYKSLNQISKEAWYSPFLRWIGWEQGPQFGHTAAALRKTKLNILQHPLFSHPIYWAPFIVVGR